MDSARLFHLIKKKGSFLCIGLDSEPEKLPPHLKRSAYPQFEFNRQIIDATIDTSAAYKINTAFYESLGSEGWINLEKTIAYLKQSGDEVFTIADAKRGDIGNTSTQYAKAFLERMDFDAITVNPYMGEDSVVPFLQFPGKWAILLALTSNKGSADFQMIANRESGRLLHEEALMRSSAWGDTDNTMYVVGATKAEHLARIRQIVPDHFLLIPGVGAQGGSLEEVARYGLNRRCGLLVNSSRGIIFASSGKDFANQARVQALELKQKMEGLLAGL